MSKKRVNISLDPEVHEKAKDLGLNVSGVAERALKVYIHDLKEGHQGDPSESRDSLGTKGGNIENQVRRERFPEASVDTILSEYEDFAENALCRAKTTVEQHSRYIGRLLKKTDKPPSKIVESDISGYLESEKPMSESKRKNIVSALRVFFREFLERDVANRFKIPAMSPHPTKVPTKRELQEFYGSIHSPKYRSIFLMYATSGLRSSELLNLTSENIVREKRMLIPEKRSEVKKTWVSFYNREAEEVFEKFKQKRENGNERLFQTSKTTVNTMFRKFSERSGVKITPQTLRRWFASEMASLGVDSTYIDAFCGRAPTSVLEKHYLDYSPRKLKGIYDEAGLTVLE